MSRTEFLTEFKVCIADSDIDKIVGIALDKGIGLWAMVSVAESAGPVPVHKQISSGGVLELRVHESGKTYIFNKSNFLTGLEEYLVSPYAENVAKYRNGRIIIDADCITVDVANCIVQLAVLGRIVCL